MNVKVCSIRVVVCLDFLMPLADFFTSGLPDSKPAPPTTETTRSKGRRDRQTNRETERQRERDRQTGRQRDRLNIDK